MQNRSALPPRMHLHASERYICQLGPLPLRVFSTLPICGKRSKHRIARQTAAYEMNHIAQQGQSKGANLLTCDKLGAVNCAQH